MPVINELFAVFDAANKDQLSEPMTRDEARQWVEDAYNANGLRMLMILQVR